MSIHQKIAICQEAILKKYTNKYNDDIIFWMNSLLVEQITADIELDSNAVL